MIKKLCIVIAFIAVISAILLSLSMLFSIDDRLVLAIDSFDLNKKTATIGENSDVCFEGLPENFKVKYDGDTKTFSYKLEGETNPNPVCVYYKINNSNPNLHTITSESALTIDCPQYEERISLDDIKALVGSAQSKYICISNLIKKKRKCSEDSVFLPEDLASFIHRNDEKDSLGNEWEVVILDNYTSIDGKNYIREGQKVVQDAKFKIQFFDIVPNSYRPEKIDEEIFNYGGKNHVMKPVVKTTGWGAGHITLQADKNNNLQVKYPKSIIYTESLDSLRARSEKTSQSVTFKQMFKTFPSSKDLFIPAFSVAANTDVCSIDLKSDSIVVIDNFNGRKSVETKLDFVPHFDKYTLQSSEATINCRIGIINKDFLMSYLVFPAIILVLILLSGIIIHWNIKNDFNGIRYYLYFLIISFITGAYALCKLLISIKLSYTYPYFEKMTGIEVVAVTAFILLFYSITVALNWSEIERKKWKKIFSVVSIVTGIAICGIALYLCDENINFDVMNSYIAADKISFKVFDWSDKSGMNDTHRTVIYMLFVAIVSVLLLLLCRIVSVLLLLLCRLFGWDKKINAIKDWFKKQFRYEPKQSDNSLETKKTSLCKDMLEHIPYLFFREKNKKTEQATYLMIFVLLSIICALILNVLPEKFSTTGIIIVCVILFIIVIASIISKIIRHSIIHLLKTSLVPCVLLYILYCLPGNFATAFITLVVVYFLSKAYTTVPKRRHEETYRDWLMRLFFSMILCSVVMVIAAMLSDNGYLTNYVGFVLACICFYWLILKYEDDGAVDASIIGEENKLRKYFEIGSLLSLLIILFVLPLGLKGYMNPEDVDYGRSGRRMMLYSQFDDLRKAGYRYTENDVEFMTVLNHYMHEESTGDPLSNEEHYLHPSVSTGQSPVVLNDVSFPSSFVGAYGQKTILVFILLLVSLVISVFVFSLSNTTKRHFDRNTQWRLLAMFMWVGTSAYIFISYYGRMPFTGRLIPGFGVDSVGEALESALLLAFIASTTISVKKQLRGY